MNSCEGKQILVLVSSLQLIPTKLRHHKTWKLGICAIPIRVEILETIEKRRIASVCPSLRTTEIMTHFIIFHVLKCKIRWHWKFSYMIMTLVLSFFFFFSSLLFLFWPSLLIGHGNKNEQKAQNLGSIIIWFFMVRKYLNQHSFFQRFFFYIYHFIYLELCVYFCKFTICMVL